RERARAPVEVQVIESDAEEQIQPSPNLLEHMTARVGPAPGRLDRGEKGLQLVEVELSDLVDRLSADGEERSRPAQPCAAAVGAALLDHPLVEPCLHVRVRLAALPVAAVVALDAPRDAAEADLASLVLLARHLRVGRRLHRDLPRLDAVENGVPDL